MSWRAVKTTGTNDIPLGSKRRFGAAPVEDMAPPQLAAPSPNDFPRSRFQESERERQSQDEQRSSAPAMPEEPRKRRSRWGEASQKMELPGLPTAISSTNISQAQLDNYAIQLRLEEINRKLRLNDYVPSERERSPSPPPTYDSQGRRTNTREVRYKKKLEEERVRLVEKALSIDPNFRPPVEYHQQKRSLRPQEKVYIPVKEFPEINFFGLLVGPRGNSLKKMEKDSGAKISIRGKGSVKEGKGRPDGFADDSEEDLHCLVMADSEEKVRACVRLINKVIETAASTPEGQNDHKRNQLRELAALNGTLRDDENQICQNCGGVGHRKYDCPEQRNFTANIICRICGSAGHMARDCTQRPNPNGNFMSPNGPPMNGNNALVRGSAGGPGGYVDSEFANLMAELGETAAAASAGSGSAPWGQSGGIGEIPAGGTSVPPWRRPEVWLQPSGGQRPQQGGQSYPGGYAGYAGQGYGGYGANAWQQAGYGQQGYAGYY
ncbi:Branchpoint-bridging protein [Serendipita indica DSM 11827]|uniref:Branchpoint-bridging protein n=1 Tax=Serendipita indica (strain DSM 11827) TaxID=1109443 RepID=G4TD45_SERID|nr:Branchpoint-bridging protein [Serendipita indica DSM 11827]CCA69254.1 probable MSL5-branch point bridging protein [Serendipita indica DSM 11827]